MASRGTAELLILLALAGCPAEEEVEGPIVLLPDDDDSAADDDDDATPDERVLRLWRVDRTVRAAGEDDRLEALAGAALGLPGTWPQTIELPDGTPLPGLTLHPDATGALDECEVLESASGWGPLPPDEASGTLTITSDAGLSNPLVLVADGERFEGSGDFDGVSNSWSLDASEPASLPPGALAGFDAPGLPGPGQPGPGPINLLGTLSVSWTPVGADAVEILLLRFASPVNDQGWEAMRCLVADAGAFAFAPIELAGPGTGPLVVSVSAAEWTLTERLEAVSVRVLATELTSG